MASLQPTLFGRYPWADGSTSDPTLYGVGHTAQNIPVNLSDTVTDADAHAIEANKALSDFLLLKEWLSVRMGRQIVWINPSENANIFDSLWGRYLYGSVLFGGLKPLASWASASRGRITWTNTNGFKYNS